MHSTHTQLAAVLILIGAASLRGDRLILNNGQTVEGLVSQETADAVVLDFGVGSTRVNRTKIARIDYSTAEERDRIRNAWTRKYFLHRSFVPKGQEEVAGTFRELLDRRISAVQAHRAVADGDERLRVLSKNEEGLERNALALSAGLSAIRGDPRDVEGYNALVVSNNAARSDLALLQHEIETVNKKRQTATETISGYLRDLAAFRQQLDARAMTASASTNQDLRLFLRRLEEALRESESETFSTTVHLRRQGGCAVTAATVNGNCQGTFVVDTGADALTISGAFARRLGVGAGSNATPSKVTLADGTTVDAKAVLLDSVQVGEARVERVEAVVLEQPPARDVDGLLGMSFLRHFVARIDGSTGKLVLTRFAPK